MRPRTSPTVLPADEHLADLVRRILAGDVAAWWALWCALDPFVEAIAGRYRYTGILSEDDDERRNVVERFFTRIHADGYRRLAGLLALLARGDGSSRAWIARVAIAVALDYTRQHSRNVGGRGRASWVHLVPLPDGAEEHLPASARGADPVDVALLHRRVAEILEPEQLQVLGLWLQGNDHADIACALGLEDAAAAARLQRSAVERLRTRLAEEPEKKIDRVA